VKLTFPEIIFIVMTRLGLSFVTAGTYLCGCRFPLAWVDLYTSIQDLFAHGEVKTSVVTMALVLSVGSAVSELDFWRLSG